MEKPERPQTPEKILGLDPRALLARRDTAERLRAWLPPEPEEIAPLFPQFEILELIGRGGMGAVYRARQPSLNRLVAIKLLPAEAAADSVFAERFRNEARVLAQLQHPHIVAIHETGQTAEGHLFIVMEFVRGHDLAQLIAKGPLPTVRALSIANAVCAALEFAHEHGVVHRDIKPANVLIADDGTVKVADFGIARIQTEAGDTRLTFTGLVLGTLDYMAPEQRRGGEVDGRADLFSLGIMLYEMLTGDLPRGAWQPPSRKATTSARLDALLEKVVQSDPTNRPQTAAEFRAELMEVSVARRGLHWISIALIASVLALFCGWWWLSPQSASSDVRGPGPPVEPPPQVQVLNSLVGTLTPLATLDIHKDVLLGNWQWVDGVEGGTLEVGYTQPPSLKVVRLPHPLGSRAFDLSCKIFFNHRGSEMSLIFPAGATRLALTLDLYDTSGLELIAGADYMKNVTTVNRSLPYERFLPLTLKVRPDGGRVAITVTLDEAPFIHWEGLQSDLRIPTDFAQPNLTAQAGSALLLASAWGGVKIIDVVVKIAPEGE